MGGGGRSAKLGFSVPPLPRAEKIHRINLWVMPFWVSGFVEGGSYRGVCNEVPYLNPTKPV